jgi:phage tail-like protein
MRPQPTFLVRFSDGEEIAFQEASGLEAQTAEHTAKIPAVHKVSDVTLKRGVIAGNAAFWNWWKNAKSQSIVIKLLDDHGRVTATWKLANARPVKVTAPDLNGKGNDVAIEEIVIAYERLEIEP